MALQITFTSKDSVQHINSYHVVNSVKNYNKETKNVSIEIRAYKDQTTKNNNIESFIGNQKYYITPASEDFDLYFQDSILLTDQKSLLKQCYEFLKKIDPEEVDSPYPSFSFDYKNDSSDV